MTEAAGKNQTFIKKLLEIISSNLGNENFGVKELARESGMSQYTLYRRLYSATGKTITQFIRETRLQKALEMLQNEEVSASEVAYKVGFGSPAYFNTCFHEFFGYPPGHVKKISRDNVKEINPVKVKTKNKQKKFRKRILIYISSGIILFAVICLLIYRVSFKHSSFRTGNEIIKDVDGNVYHTVTIGTQVWLAEDLRTTRYNDGTPISYVTDTAVWRHLHTGAFRWANNEDSVKTKFGALYNWYTTDLGKLCPVGWHVSTDKDWEMLVDYCGGWEIAGGKLKETGTEHWDSPNIGATNEFGFTALPIGGRGRDLGYWCPPRCGDFRSLCSDRAWIYLTESHAYEACCVRCVKN